MTESFQPILTVAEVMRAFPRPWFASGGWAIDLFLQNVTRCHADIEIGIYRQDQLEIRQFLIGWNLDKAVSGPDGGKWISWKDGEYLCLPVHQVRANRTAPLSLEFELFLNERTETHWTSRRHVGLTRPLDRVVLMSFLNIPILAPEI